MTDTSNSARELAQEIQRDIAAFFDEHDAYIEVGDDRLDEADTYWGQLLRRIDLRLDEIAEAPDW